MRVEQSAQLGALHDFREFGGQMLCHDAVLPGIHRSCTVVQALEQFRQHKGVGEIGFMA